MFKTADITVALPYRPPPYVHPSLSMIMKQKAVMFNMCLSKSRIECKLLREYSQPFIIQLPETSYVVPQHLAGVQAFKQEAFAVNITRRPYSVAIDHM